MSQKKSGIFIQRSTADSAHFFTLGKTPFCRQTTCWLLLPPLRAALFAPDIALAVCRGVLQLNYLTLCASKWGMC